MGTTKYRVEVTVRVVPLDTKRPVTSRTFEVEADSKSSGDRVFTGMTIGNKASEGYRRAYTEIYGEEPL